MELRERVGDLEWVTLQGPGRYEFDELRDHLCSEVAHLSGRIGDLGDRIADLEPSSWWLPPRSSGGGYDLLSPCTLATH